MNTNGITVGYVIHQKENLILSLLEGLKTSFGKEDEFIFLFDNCTDKSLDILMDNKNLIPGDYKVITSDEDLFEIVANNKILMKAAKETIILFQDDIICKDPNIKQKIRVIQDKYGDRLGLMGGRSGFEIKGTTFPENIVDRVSNWEHLPNQYGLKLKEGEYRERTFLNRGPIVFTKNLIKEAGLLDETYYPQQWDDADYCANAKYNYGKTNVVFQCNVKSHIKWGSTRSKKSNLYKLTKGRHVRANWDLFISRWGKYCLA